MWPSGMQALLDQIGDGRLAGAGKAGEPQDARLLAGLGGARRLVHVERLPVDVGGAAQREVDEPHADRVVGEAVDDDEAAEIAVLVIGREGEWAGRDRDCTTPISLRLERLGRDMLERVDVDLVFRLLEGARNGARRRS